MVTYGGGQGGGSGGGRASARGAAAGSAGGAGEQAQAHVCRCSTSLLYWYKSTNTEAARAGRRETWALQMEATNFFLQKCIFFLIFLGAHRSTQESRRALEMEATRATATAFTTAEKLLLLRLLLQRSSLEMEATRATATAFTHLLLL